MYKNDYELSIKSPHLKGKRKKTIWKDVHRKHKNKNLLLSVYVVCSYLCIYSIYVDVDIAPVEGGGMYKKCPCVGWKAVDILHGIYGNIIMQQIRIFAHLAETVLNKVGKVIHKVFTQKWDGNAQMCMCVWILIYCTYTVLANIIFVGYYLMGQATKKKIFSIYTLGLQ
jgi:hypothetical protein